MKVSHVNCNARWRGVLLATLAVAIAATSALAQTAAENAKAPANGSARMANAPSSAKPTGGTQEGIKVHGHWVIEVRNPDGTLAQRREFQNALTDGGAQVLAALLAGRANPGRWEVWLAALSSGVSPCQGGVAGEDENLCRIIQSDATNTTGGNAESRDLSVVMGAGNTSVILRGTITALANGSVQRVATSLGTCATNVPTQSCFRAGSANFFTDALLGVAGKPPVVAVVAGQIIQVTVTLSFS